MEILLAAFAALFSVANPFGAMPLFVSLTQDYDDADRKQQALKSAFFMLIILIVFFFAGTVILDFFGIRMNDIRIAGGILIVRSGFQLMTPGSHKGKPLHKGVVEEGKAKDDISFTPMAMPMLSGPGAIAVTIGLFDQAKGEIEFMMMILAITLVSVTTAFILLISPQLNRFLGAGGMAALSRMMGFIVLSIGISMILKGLLPLLTEAIKN
ncbi:MAG: MarC family protein [Cyclobacteriaceae bacterium]|nr:NAAT family transporter [Cyclobacteriaceae bacterium]MCH8517567.1 MarC family protein [Cyclobacteriaceae bacterium]